MESGQSACMALSNLLIYPMTIGIQLKIDFRISLHEVGFIRPYSAVQHDSLLSMIAIMLHVQHDSTC